MKHLKFRKMNIILQDHSYEYEIYEMLRVVEAQGKLHVLVRFDHLMG